MQNREFFDEQEAEEILRLAAGDMTHGGLSRDRLMATAAELGISPDAVMRAEEQVFARKMEVAERAEYDRKIRADFFSHLASYVTVNAGLLAMNWFTAGSITWAWWPLGAWGFGLANDFVETFIRGSKDYQENFEKWRRRKNRIALTPPSGEAGLEARGVLDQWFEMESPDQKLSAIKHLRERLSLSLVDAKSEVDRYYETQGWR